MRLFVTILASIVLFLSTQCIIMGSNIALKAQPPKNSCCAKNKTCSKPEKKEEKDKDCKDACNPFMACCGCLYDGMPKNEIAIVKPIAYSVQNGYRENFFKSTYSSGLWQPPEIVI